MARSAAKRKTLVNPSPLPRPSPSMGKLALALSSQPPPPPPPALAACASESGAAMPLDLFGDLISQGPPRPARRPSTHIDQPPLPGRIVSSTPVDWALKRSCTVTSTGSLGWACAPAPQVLHESLHAASAAEVLHPDDTKRTASALEPCSRQNGGSGVGPGVCVQLAGEQGVSERGVGEWGVERGGETRKHERLATARAVALHRALTHWVHPALKLPVALSKLLVASESRGHAEAAYALHLREQWEAALRSLYYAFRQGQCPYFYCRHESFTLLWRNAALKSGAGSGMGLGVGVGFADARSEQQWPCELWRYLAAGGGDACVAWISPSNRGLRAQLRAAAVPFDMPCAILDEGVRHNEHAAPPPFDTCAAYEADRAEALEASLALGVDGKRPSLLRFRGSSALHALYDFLLISGSAFHLSVQLLSPVSPLSTPPPYDDPPLNLVLRFGVLRLGGGLRFVPPPRRCPSALGVLSLRLIKSIGVRYRERERKRERERERDIRERWWCVIYGLNVGRVCD